MKKMIAKSPTLGSRKAAVVGVVLAALLAVLVVPRTAHAHCDSMDGPVVPIAQEALESGVLTPVLKWVRRQDEPTIRAAFDRARAIRSEGSEVRELADLWFLETLVRVHRQGEGAPYTGLEPAGSMNPVFAAADAALETGSVDELATRIGDAVKQEIEQRFGEAFERRKRAEESVELGRDYVEAYVTYMHFVESIDALIHHGGPDHHDPDPDACHQTGHGEER